MYMYIIYVQCMYYSLLGGQPTDSGTISSPDGNIRFEVRALILPDDGCLLTDHFVSGDSCTKAKRLFIHRARWQLYF